MGSTYALWDVQDVEKFCAHIATLFCNRTRTRLSAADMEDLVAYLVAETWRLSEKFRPTTPAARFRSYAHGQLCYRCTDWMRSHRGRSRWQWADHSYERIRPQLVSLDAPIGDDGSGGTLGDTLPSRAGDGSPDRDEAPLWLHDLGDSTRAADTALLRAEFRRRARGRARRKRALRG